MLISYIKITEGNKRIDKQIKIKKEKEKQTNQREKEERDSFNYWFNR
jgi:hypothetical protein